MEKQKLTPKQKIDAAFELVATRANGESRNFAYQAASEYGTLPYWDHLEDVCQLLVFWGTKNIDVIVAGILHDIVEDHEVTLEEIEEMFGRRVRSMVNLCSKPNTFSDNDLQTVTAYYQRFIDHLAVDEEEALGAMLIKVADRATNLFGILFSQKTTEAKRNYIDEAAKYFLPMADRVGRREELTNSMDFARLLIEN